MPTPTVPGWGFFMRAASRAVWNSPPSLPMGEEEERGKQAVVPPAALLPSLLYIHRRNSVQCMVLRPACAHASSAVRTRLVWHLGTTTGIPWTMAAPRHHGRDTLVSPAAGLREGRSLALRQRRNAAKPASLWSRLTRDVSHVCWGCSTVCRRTSTRESSRMGRPRLGCLVQET